MHLARRMAGREIERGEIVVVGLDVRPFGDGEAEIGEDGGDLVDDLADRMDAAGLQRLGAHRQGDVDRFRRQATDEVLLLENGAAGGERLADPVLEAVQRRPHDLALVRRHGAEALHQFGDAALLAKRGDALGLQRRLIGGFGNTRGNVALERDDIGFGCGHFGIRPGPSSGSRFQQKTGQRTSAARGAVGRRMKSADRTGKTPLKGRDRQAVRAPAALSTSVLNEAGSLTASSARTLRSISTPALPRPLINRP